jgi:hypothetical protein
MNSGHSVRADKTKEIGIELRLIKREVHTKSALPDILPVTKYIDVSIRVLEVDGDTDVRRVKVEVPQLKVVIVLTEILLRIAQTIREIHCTLLLDRAIEDVVNLITLTIQNSGDALVLPNVRESIVKRSPLRAIIINLINKLLLNSKNIDKALKRLLTELVTIVKEAVTLLFDVLDIQRNEAVALKRLANIVALGNELI